MPSYQKLINGLTDLGLHKMQEHLDYYIKAVNSGEKSFSEALEELIEIEKANNSCEQSTHVLKQPISLFSKQSMTSILVSNPELTGKKSWNSLPLDLLNVRKISCLLVPAVLVKHIWLQL